MSPTELFFIYHILQAQLCVRFKQMTTLKILRIILIKMWQNEKTKPKSKSSPKQEKSQNLTYFQ